MSETTEFSAAIEATAQQIETLQGRLSGLRRKHRKELGRRFIEFTGITRDDVQLSSGDGMPYFGVLWRFADWIRNQPVQKKYVEWNTLVYLTADILQGSMESTNVCMDDLPQAATT